MQISFNKLSEHLRACANCGRGTFLRTSAIDLYCSDCWATLFKLVSFDSSHEYPFKTKSLFVWTNFTPQIENLIYSLKGGALPSAFQKLAEQFAFGLCSEFQESQAVLVVPPSSREPEKDHALAWGRALGEVFGLEVHTPFEFATEGKTTAIPPAAPQKRLRISQRFERQFKLKDGISLEGSQIVFVDDLITSGATAIAAQKALKSVVDFEVWTIARRPKLAAI